MLQTVQVWKRLKALPKNLEKYQSRFKKGAIASVIVLALGISACGNDGRSTDLSPRIINRMSEVSPPAVVQALTTMNQAQPKVAIVSPRPDAVIDNDNVAIRLRVENLDLYKEDSFELGPHLNILVDNEFYGTVYDTSEALELAGLTPGTHSLRAIAASAWDESFKNPDAYAQSTFHIFTKTPVTAPPTNLPVLTYGQPINTYGAEPILLDYFFSPGTSTLTSSTPPTEDDPDPIIQGWKVRATVNGEPFIFDQWEPIYLKGFKPGKNWVQMELLDADEKPIESLFNNTARIIEYVPGGDDTLSRLMRDELVIEDVGGLVDPNYSPPMLEPEAPEEVDDNQAVDNVESMTDSIEEELGNQDRVPQETVDTISDEIEPTVQPLESLGTESAMEAEEPLDNPETSLTEEDLDESNNATVEDAIAPSSDFETFEETVPTPFPSSAPPDESVEDRETLEPFSALTREADWADEANNSLNNSTEKIVTSSSDEPLDKEAMEDLIDAEGEDDSTLQSDLNPTNINSIENNVHTDGGEWKDTVPGVGEV